MQDDDAEILAAAREGFLVEAREQLQAFESALLVMETDPADAENLNAAFRAAHTIKGTAGLFGCDAVASFTHEVETLMEALRSGQRAVSPEISASLLESLDQIGALLGEINLPAGAPEVARRSAELGAQLRRLCGSGAPHHAGSGPSPSNGTSNGTSNDASNATSNIPSGAAAGPAASQPPAAPWHLSLRFGPDALRNGLDPLAFLRYLGSLGTVGGIRTLVDQVPALDALDAEACHLGFELRLDTRHHPATDRAAIEQVFEFAREDAAITVLEPFADAAAYTALLAERCGDDAERRKALQALWAELAVAAPDTSPPAAAGKTATSAPPSACAPAVEPPAGAPAERRHGTADRRAPESPRRQADAARGAPAARSAAGDDARYVRVRADKLDHLIDIIGELVIAGSGVQAAALAEAAAQSQEAAQRVCDLVEEARDGALALRMVPVGETFARFHRVVRDVSKQLGKEVELVISGGDTELDKSMVDVIADPLTHLVRNSLDHGI
ncbi:MAG: Hpt domain-containing protein, partial [Rubrivivax sp.]|nr:Hpt domain-containing protein [Rubrivivax sp.]